MVVVVVVVTFSCMTILFPPVYFFSWQKLSLCQCLRASERVHAVNFSWRNHWPNCFMLFACSVRLSVCFSFIIVDISLALKKIRQALKSRKKKSGFCCKPSPFLFPFSVTFLILLLCFNFCHLRTAKLWKCLMLVLFISISFFYLLFTAAFAPNCDSSSSSAMSRAVCGITLPCHKVMMHQQTKQSKAGLAREVSVISAPKECWKVSSFSTSL